MSRLLVPVSLVLLGYGCEKSEEQEPVDSFSLAVEARAGVPSVAREAAVVTLVVPTTAVLGARVPIQVRVTNATSAPLDLYLRGRTIAFDLVVTDSTGDQVWRRLEGEVVQAILQLKTLAAGEVLELRGDWNQKDQNGDPVPAGVYSIQGSVLTDGKSSLVSSPAKLEIRPKQ